MNRKEYNRPSMETLVVMQQKVIMTSDETSTTPYYPDDPQDPGNALSRRRGKSLWDDEDEGEE